MLGWCFCELDYACCLCIWSLACLSSALFGFVYGAGFWLVGGLLVGWAGCLVLLFGCGYLAGV